MARTKIPYLTISLAISLIGTSLAQGEAPAWLERLTEWVSPELAEVNRQLAQIAQETENSHEPMNVNSGIRRGFETRKIEEGKDAWVELKLAQATTADSIVLIPMLAKGTEGEVPGYGFPRRFQLEAQDEDGDIYLLLDERASDFPNPGQYPVLAECPPGIKLSSFRLTATEPWNRGGQKILALAEFMVLKGNLNIARGGKITASSSRRLPPTWSTQNLLDMVTPLGLPITTSERNLSGWRSENSSKQNAMKSVIVDLGSSYPLDEIRLIPTWNPELPLLFNYGLPSRFRIDTFHSQLKDPPLTITDQTIETLQSPGQNIQFFDVGGSEVRFIKLESTRLRANAGDYFLALSELQAYSNGENVARNAKVISSESVEDESWGKAALTDGLVGNGKLIELPEWFQNLENQKQLKSRQTDLEKRRDLLFQQGEQRLVGGSITVTGAIAFIASLLLWQGKRQRQHDREQHRERLARDLHDELGSNLGSIALISSFSLEGQNNEEEMRKDLIEIEEVARESANSMRDMVELLGGRYGGAESDWLDTMQRLAERLLRGVQLDCRLPESPLTHVPNLETCREIYLFCKEVLYNISKHAQANQVQFYLRPHPNGLEIEIADDGFGFDLEQPTEGHGLSNIRARAESLRATLSLDSSPGNGTILRIQIPRGRRWRKATGMKK